MHMTGAQELEEFKAALSNLSGKIEAMCALEKDRMDRWEKFFDKLESVVVKVCNQDEKEKSRSDVVVVNMSRPVAAAPAGTITRTLNRWLGITKENDKWLNEMRGNLSTVASIIATMTFQVGLNPPGGFVQNLENGIVNCPEETKNTTQLQGCPGDSVSSINVSDYFYSFMLFNNIAFYSSLVVCMCLVSGLPLHHRFPTWLLALTMCVSLTSLALTYFFGVAMINTNSFDAHPNIFFDKGLDILSFLALIVVCIFFMRFFFLLKSIICNKPQQQPPSDNT